MSDLLTKLVERAWDIGPRARPQLAPRFAPRSTSPSTATVEETWVEVDAPPAERASATRGDAPPDTGARRANVDPSALRLRSPLPTSPASHVDAAPRIEGARERETIGATAHHDSPHIVESTRERVRAATPQTPVAAPPPPLRREDAATLRPAPEARRHEAQVTPQEALRIETKETTAATPSEAHTFEPLHISIGRIDVRAAVTAAPVAPRSNVREPSRTALPLADYLGHRGPREGR